MSGIDYSQILDSVDFGALVMAPDTTILSWNRWLADVSGHCAGEAVGKRLSDLYPQAMTPAFLRNMKSVLAFGNFAFFSQKIHGSLIPLPARAGLSLSSGLMQQQCRMGPIWSEGKVGAVFLIIQDVTQAVRNEAVLADQALRDGLTGVHNRRFFDSRLAAEAARLREGGALCVLMVDIDHFKAINDRRGHEVGDAALRAVAAKVDSMVRKSDTFARYCGEEFCVLMPDCPLEPARALAERLRAAVEALRIEDAAGESFTVTISLGLAQGAAGMGPQDILRMADAALYAAKSAGRNRSMVYGQPPPPA